MILIDLMGCILSVRPGDLRSTAIEQPAVIKALMIMVRTHLSGVGNSSSWLDNASLIKLYSVVSHESMDCSERSF